MKQGTLQPATHEYQHAKRCSGYRRMPLLVVSGAPAPISHPNIRALACTYRDSGKNISRGEGLKISYEPKCKTHLNFSKQTFDFSATNAGNDRFEPILLKKSFGFVLWGWLRRIFYWAV
ncbi:MAG: hypothetical protein GKR98_11170 [Boseongicola sp.]|nr:MAG: hypothetical protein GKR98_11170 [Boseongicola sp.]